MYWPEVVAIRTVSDSQMHFRWLALKNVRLLHPSLKFRYFCFLASSGSFNVKNDNIHRFFFSLFWLQMLNLLASLQNKNTRVGPYCKILTEKEPIRARGIA